MPQTVELEIGVKGWPGGGADYTDFNIAGISARRIRGRTKAVKTKLPVSEEPAL